MRHTSAASRLFLGVALTALTLALSLYANGAPRPADTVVLETAAKDIAFIKSPTLSIDEKLARLGKLKLPLLVTAISSVGPQERSALWRAHTSRWLKDGNLNAAQRDVLRRQYEMQVPALWDKSSPDNPRLLATLKGLCEAGEAVFPDRRVKTAAMAAIGTEPGDPLPVIPMKKIARPGMFSSLWSLLVIPVRANAPICFCGGNGCFNCATNCQCPDFGGVCDPSSPGTCGCSSAQNCDAYCALCGG